MISILISALMTFSYSVSNVADYSHKAHLENVYKCPLGMTYYNNTLYEGQFIYTYSCDLYFNDEYNWYIDDFKQQIQFYFDVGGGVTTPLLDYFYTDNIQYNNNNFDTFSNYYHSRIILNAEDQEIDYYIYGGSSPLNYGYVDDLGYQLLYYFDYDFNLIDNGELYNSIVQYIKSTFYYEGSETQSYNDGYNNGYQDGFDSGYSEGGSSGYQTGYIAGYNEGSTQDDTAVAIFTGIIQVGLLPINFFLAMLNFEVFGINIGAFVSAMLTVAIVIIIIRVITGSGNGDKK